jgi:hypothetical protein
MLNKKCNSQQISTDCGYDTMYTAVRPGIF